MPEQIISASGTQYGMIVNADGSINTTASVSVGSISAGSESFMYGRSGTSWWPLLVESGTGKLVTTATVTVDSVFIASGANIGSVNLINGAYVNVIPSGTFYATVAPSGVIPVSGAYFPGSVSQSTNPWIVTGSVNIDNASSIGSIGTQNVKGNIFVVSGNNWNGVGSVYTVNSPTVTTGSESWIKNFSELGSNVVVTNLYAGSLVWQGTSPWIVGGSVNVDNASSIGSLGVQTITGNVGISTSPVPVSGVVTVDVNNVSTIGSLATQGVIGSVQITNSFVPISGAITVGNMVAGSIVYMPSLSVTAGSDSYIYGKSGTNWVAVKVDETGIVQTSASVTVDRVYIASGADIGSVYIKPNQYINVIQSGNNWAASGVVTANINNASTIGSLAVQNVNGSVYINSTNYVNVKPSGITPVSGTYFPGSVSQATSPWIVLGSTQLTNNVLQVSGNVTISNDSYVKISPSGTLYTTGSVNLVNGAFVNGSVHITNTVIPVSGVLSVTTGSEVWVKNFSELGSSVVVTNMVAGSIVYMPDINVSTGSVVYQGTSPWVIAGSISSMPGISVDSVYIASGATIGSVYLKDGAYVSVIPSGTFYTSGSVNLVNGAFITGSVNVDNASTIGSLGVQNIAGSVYQVTNPWVTLGSTQITNSVIQVSGNVTISNDNYIKVTPSGTFYSSVSASGTTGIPVSGQVTVSNLATAGSLATQGIIGSVQITNSVLQISGPVKLTNDSFVKVIPSGTFYTTGSFNLANGAFFTGSVNVNNSSIVGSLAVQAVTGTVISSKGDTNYTKIYKQVTRSTAGSTAMWIPAGGTRAVVTDILVSVGSPGNNVSIYAGGSTIAQTFLATNGGFVTNLQTPFTTQTNGSVFFQISAAGSVGCSLFGYEI